MTEPQFDLVAPWERRGVPSAFALAIHRADRAARHSVGAGIVYSPRGRQVCLSAFHLAGQLYFDGPVPRSLPRWRAWGHVDWSRGAWARVTPLSTSAASANKQIDFPELGIVFDPWGAPTSSSCAMHFGSSLVGCRHEARLRLEPREFRLNRLPE